MLHIMSSSNSDHTHGINTDNNTHADNFPWELNWNLKTHWPETVPEFDIVDYPFTLDQLHTDDDRDVIQSKQTSLHIHNGATSTKKRKEKDKSDSDSDSSDSVKCVKMDQRKHPNLKLIKKDLQKQQLEHHTWIQHKKLFEKQEYLFGKVKDVCVNALFDILNHKLETKTTENNVNNTHIVDIERQLQTDIVVLPSPCTEKDIVTEIYLGYWYDGLVFQTGHWAAAVESIGGTRKLYGIIRFFFRDINGQCCVCLTQVHPRDESPNWTAKTFTIGADKVLLANCLTEILKLNRYKH